MDYCGCSVACHCFGSICSYWAESWTVTIKQVWHSWQGQPLSGTSHLEGPPCPSLKRCKHCGLLFRSGHREAFSHSSWWIDHTYVNRGDTKRQIAIHKIIVPKADHQTLMRFTYRTTVNTLTHRQQLVKYSGYIFACLEKVHFYS